MGEYKWWAWSDPDELHKQQADDLISFARQQQEQNDRAQIQQHVGGILENFQADVARRMQPLQDAAAPPAPTAPAPSPVDTVLSRFRDSASRMGSDIAGAAGRFASDPSKLLFDPGGGQRALDAVPEGIKQAAQSKYALDPVGQGSTDLMEQMGVPGHDSAFGTSLGPVELGPREIAGFALGTAINPLGKAGKAAEAGSAFLRGAASEAPAAINAATRLLTHSPAPAVATSAAEKIIDGSMGQATGRVGSLKLKGATYQLFDDLAPVQKLMDARAEVLGRKLEDSENGYEILRLGRASREIADEWYTTHVGDALGSLPQISGSVDQGTQDLNRYLRAKDTIDKAAATGNPDRLFGSEKMTAAVARQGLDDLQTRLGPDKFAALEGAAQKFYDLGDFLLDRKVQAGLVSADTADKLKALYPHYMPIQTIDWLDDKLSSTSSRVGRAGGAANDIKALTEFGTDRSAEAPIEAFRRAADRTAALSAKNEAGAAIVAAARDAPMTEGLIRPADNATAKLTGLPTGGAASFARRPGEVEQRFRINGEVASFWTDKSMEPLFNFSTSVGDMPFKGILTASADVTRKAAIGYNPSWGVYQLAKDSLTYLVKNGGLTRPADLGRNIKRLGVAADEVGLSPFQNRVAGAGEGAVAGALLGPGSDGEPTWTDRARNAAIGAGVGAGLKSTGLLQRADRGALYSEARMAGALPGAVDHVSGETGSYSKLTSKLTGIDVNGPADFVRKATRALGDSIEGFNQKLDSIPRLAEYQTATAGGASAQKAALAARDITIDPSRGGAFTRRVNAVVPFFNVAFQSAAYAPRLLLNKDPKVAERAASGIASSVILPAVALEYYNQQDPRYQDVPDFDKDRGFILMTPGHGQIDPSTGREKPTYLTVRTDAYTPFVIMARALYNASPAGQGVDVGKTVGGVVRSASPIDVSPVTDAVAGHANAQDTLKAAGNVAMKYAPPLIKLGAEVTSNFDTFRNRPLVPAGLASQPIENQYTQDTSETAKLLAPMLHTAPAVLDHVLKAWGGGADAAVGGLDTVLGAFGATQAGESQRLVKLRRDLADAGDDEARGIPIQNEIDRELAIKAERDNSLRNVPIVGGLGSRYYRESGGQSLDDRSAAVDTALLDKKRDTSPVGKELQKHGIDFGDVKDEIAGVKLTREMGADYREKALAYRTKVLGDLVASKVYADADGTEQKRLINGAMEQAAGWAAYDAAEKNPVLTQRLQDNPLPGVAFVTPQIDKNVEVASRRYIGALAAQASLDELKGNERYRNVAPQDAQQVASDQATLSGYKRMMPDVEAEMAFVAKYGEARLNQALSARQSKFWGARMDAFRRDNPDYGLFIESAPSTFTRKGLDAQTVARMAGL